MAAPDRTSSPLGALRSLPVEHPWLTLAAWVLVLVTVALSARSFGGGFEDDIELPGTQAAAGADLLADQPSTAGVSGVILIHVAEGSLAEHGEQVAAALADLRGVEHVLSVHNPLEGSAGPVSEDGRTARITVRFDDSPRLLGSPLVTDVDDALDPLRADVQVEYAGTLGRQADAARAPRAAELIGIGAALLLLLLIFGSVLAAFLPLLTAVLSAGAGLGLLTLAASVASFGTSSTALATMIGLGTGIDYALFLVTRGRQHLMDGMSPADAARATLHSSGHAVLVAAVTVAVALLGLYASGVAFVGQLGLAATFTVATAAFGAITLVPAALTLLGRRIDRVWVRRPVAEPASDGHGWYRYSALVARRPWPFLLGGVAVLLVLSAPLLDLRLGHVDEGSSPTTFTSRAAYDLNADAFGAGSNAPFTAVLDTDGLDTDAAASAADVVRRAIAADPGVAAVTPLTGPDDSAVRVGTVTPTTGPSDPATEDLFLRLSDEVVPQALAGTGAELVFTGATTGQMEFGARVSSRLPVIIAVVVGASFLLLVLAFRSLVLAVKAALLNLLSIGSAYGVVVAIFQWGWGSSLLGLDHGVPIESFVPMMMFAIVFGLSMDYEVFLLTRVREAWLRTGDNTASVAEGLGATARVITCAALVMVSVFLAFATDDDITIQMMAVGLAASVALDASVVRLVLVPASMALLGGANWWLPGWLDRLVPGGERPPGRGRHAARHR